jgi:electron transfer flavoprotein alpha subunit
MAILVVASHDNIKLHAGVLNTVSAARELGTDIHVVVAGADCHPVAREAAAIQGVGKVRVADDGVYRELMAEDLAELMVSLAKEYSHVLAPADSFGKNLMPRVAALLGVAQVSDVVAIVTPDTFVRPIYAGSAFATVQASDPVKVLTVRSTAFDPAEHGNDAAIESVVACSSAGLTRLVERKVIQSARPELAGARVVVSGGRGLGSGEKFRGLLEPLADTLGAALGASRAAVDAGFVSNDHQVGQTGKIVAPQLYLAVGISGAVQHLAGMKESKWIVAINKDPDAPIFQVADYGLVADLFEAVPHLTKALAPS